MKKILCKYQDFIFFYIPLIIFVASSYFRTFQFVFDYFEILSTLLLIAGIVINLKNMTKKEIICLFVTGFITGIIFLVSRDITIVKFFLFIFGAYNIKFTECVKIDFYVRLVCLITVLLLNSLGVIPSVDITRGEIMRYSFGFSHPNNFAYKILIMLFEYFYLNNFKSISRNAVITFIIVLFLDHYTNSRTAELLILFVFIFGTILNKTKINIFEIKSLKHLISNSYFYFALLILISFILYRFNNDLGYSINNLLSKRLYYIDGYYTKYGVSLFGNNFAGFVSSKNPLDVGFAHVLIRYGIIAFFAIGIAFKKVFNVIFDKKNISYLVILFAFIIYTITENSFLRIEQNIFMLIFVILFKQKEGIFFER